MQIVSSLMVESEIVSPTPLMDAEDGGVPINSRSTGQWQDLVSSYDASFSFLCASYILSSHGSL